jgi:hypothetical protein
VAAVEQPGPAATKAGTDEQRTSAQDSEGSSQSPASTSEQADEAAIRGPSLWLNWRALQAGLPPRASSRTDAAQVLPLWQEFGLHSDSPLVDELVAGPYRLLHALPPQQPALGRAQLAFVFRSRDHLLDPSYDPIDLEEQDVKAYAGGDLGDQMASLLALALARRLRSGGVMRNGYEGEPEGKPIFADYEPPSLIAPRHRSVLPGLAEPSKISDAAPFLEVFSRLSGSDAVAVMRAAHQYADALWLCDADPRMSWIKLFGALEAAADRWDYETLQSAEAQLQRRHSGMYERLSRKAPGAIPIVAKSLSRILGAESKMIDFVLAHAPKPPARRPEIGQLDFDDLEPVLRVLYDHRSRDLHGGVPFPQPLCGPPVPDNGGIPIEVFPALGASSGGASWPAKQLPMFLHTFVYIVGETLRNWWLALPAANEGNGGNT